jgi:DNA-directed RNA polymerase subunit beta
MNVGQVLETHLGWVAKHRLAGRGHPWSGWAAKLPEARSHAEPAARTPTSRRRCSTGAKEDEIVGLLGSTICPTATARRMVWSDDGKARLFDGRSGEPFPTRSRSATSTS